MADRHAHFAVPHLFIKNKSDQFIDVTDNNDPDSDSSFLIITRVEFTALRALAREALLKTEATHTSRYSLHTPPKIKQKCTRTSLHKLEPSVEHPRWV